MRVIVNGKEVGALTRDLEERITVRQARGPAEGAVLSADQAVAAVARSLRPVIGAVLGVGILVGLAAVAAAAAYEPKDLIVVVPLTLSVAAFVGWMVVWAYRRNTGKTRARAESHLSEMPAGERIAVEEDALVVGLRRVPWPEVSIETVSVTDTTLNEERVAFIQWLELAASGRRLILDSLLIANGRAVVDHAWRRLRASPSSPTKS